MYTRTLRDQKIIDLILNNIINVTDTYDEDFIDNSVGYYPKRTIKLITGSFLIYDYSSLKTTEALIWELLCVEKRLNIVDPMLNSIIKEIRRFKVKSFLNEDTI